VMVIGRPPCDAFLFGIGSITSLRGAKRRSNSFFLGDVRWIASLRSQ
jgi:hypothetical protein